MVTSPNPLAPAMIAAALLVLSGCSSADEGKSDDVPEVNALGLPEACLAFEAAAPPGLSEEVREELEETPKQWRFYRTGLGNFSWSTGDPLFRIEMGRNDDYDPTDTDVWRAMNDYHQIIEKMGDDHFAAHLREPLNYPKWEEGHRALTSAGHAVEEACAEVGAEVEIADKNGLLLFEQGSLY